MLGYAKFSTTVLFLNELVSICCRSMHEYYMLRNITPGWFKTVRIYTFEMWWGQEAFSIHWRVKLIPYSYVAILTWSVTSSSRLLTVSFGKRSLRNWKQLFSNTNLYNAKKTNRKINQCNVFVPAKHIYYFIAFVRFTLHHIALIVWELTTVYY